DRTLAAVLAALARHGVEPVVTGTAPDAAARRGLARARLVISVGGDGTLLAASHHVTAGALLGVNSAPRDSVGHFALARRETIARVLDSIAAGRLRPFAVTRIRTLLDGAAVGAPALNDVLVAHQHPAATSRYLLRRGRIVEEHRSSGLWIATAAGSTGGIRSSGGAVMSLRSRRLQFRARELYRRPGTAHRLVSGFVPPGATLVVESQMDAGWLFVDGSRIGHRFAYGARAELRAAPEPLRIYTDPARWAQAAAAR
ncbi:MAG TPA: NAD(+) kinase, partial [Thermoanaerobaculia bacterium]|nr:NAD(+) kinase [Thermoanaerobaculia bacterium]